MRSIAFRRCRLAFLLVVLPLACAGPEAPGPAVEQKSGALAGVTVKIDWSMPDMFGNDFDGDGLIDLIPVAPSDPTRSPVVGLMTRPSAWKVTLNGCGSTPTAASYWWNVMLPTGVLTTAPSASCSTVVNFPRQGNYQVTLNMRMSQNGPVASGTSTIVVKNYLVVSMGDSVASGEGNPDVPSQNGAAPRWVDTRCHRSALSGPAQAALAFERADPHSSVTFISVACSGASVETGLVGSYAGEQPPSGSPPPLQPQVIQAQQLACPILAEPPGTTPPPCSPIDALLVSVGANDIDFSQIVKDCAVPDNTCSDDDFPLWSCTTDVYNQETDLPAKYEALNKAITKYLPVKQVYVTEYFDPTHDDSGQFCQEMVLPGAVSDSFTFNADGVTISSPLEIDGNIDYNDVVWAHDKVILPLNAYLRDAARQYGWNYISGITDEFGTHGYCASNNWVVRYEQSKANEAGTDGTMHPNAGGQDSYARHILAKLQEMAAPAATMGAAHQAGTPQTDVYARGEDGRVWTRDWDGSGPSPWSSMGGDQTSGTPVALWAGAGAGTPQLHVLATGHDGALRHWSRYPNSFTGWDTEPGPGTLGLLGTPVAASPQPGELDVFMQGGDGRLWHNALTNPGWGTWETIGAPSYVGLPSVVANGQSRLDIVVRGGDGALHHGWENKAVSWAGDWQWESLGGVLTADPKIVSWGPGRLDIFVRGSNFQLYHAWSNSPHSWLGWEPLGGTFTSQLEVTSWGPNRVDILGRGLDGALWHDWFDNGWGTLHSLGGLPAGGTSSVSSGPGSLDVFFQQTDGQFYQESLRNTTSWLPIAPLSLTTAYDSNCSYVRAGEGLIASPSAQSTITSCDGRFSLVLQSDGNLMFNQNGVPFWSAATSGLGGTIAAMQPDGNFVIYTATGIPVWSTNTSGQPGAYLVLQNDGNLVIYNAAGSAVWASNTCCR